MLLMTPACQREWGGFHNTGQGDGIFTGTPCALSQYSTWSLGSEEGGGGVGVESFPYLITEVLVKYLHACMHVKIDRRIFFFLDLEKIDTTLVNSYGLSLRNAVRGNGMYMDYKKKRVITAALQSRD